MVSRFWDKENKYAQGFLKEGHSKTWGAMNEEEQKQTSMRRIALKEMESVLKKST